MDIAGLISAKDLSIIWGSDTRYWKWNTIVEIVGQRIEVAELVGVCWLGITGSYPIQKLVKGMRYKVSFLVKLNDDLHIVNPVDITLTLPDGTKKTHPKNLMEMPRNKVVEIPVGEFEASGSMCEGNGDVEFSMLNTDGDWKKGLVVIGAVVAPHGHIII